MQRCSLCGNLARFLAVIRITFMDCKTEDHQCCGQCCEVVSTDPLVFAASFQDDATAAPLPVAWDRRPLPLH